MSERSDWCFGCPGVVGTEASRNDTFASGVILMIWNKGRVSDRKFGIADLRITKYGSLSQRRNGCEPKR
jgi:hypothetical protein